MLRREGLPHMRFHDLRHATATYMLGEGVELKVVQQVLGHAQIGVTANTYAHVVPALQRDAARRLGNVLWGHS
jgi:integrase